VDERATAHRVRESFAAPETGCANEFGTTAIAQAGKRVYLKTAQKKSGLCSPRSKDKEELFGVKDDEPESE
jgi:hypothetical protein